jgi:Nucleotidyl transferase AbiEii toxin, Type IV TA system
MYRASWPPALHSVWTSCRSRNAGFGTSSLSCRRNSCCTAARRFLHLGHRQSEHFDFFAPHPFDPAKLATSVPFMAAATITQRAPNRLSGIVERGGPVRVSFFGVPEISQFASPRITPDTGLRVASLLDLAGTKASLVQQHAEAKDYVDVDAILRTGRIDLPTALAVARYGTQFNPQITLKALSYFEDGTVRDLLQAAKDRLAKAAREVDLDRLPILAARLAWGGNRNGPRP